MMTVGIFLLLSLVVAVYVQTTDARAFIVPYTEGAYNNLARNSHGRQGFGSPPAYRIYKRGGYLDPLSGGTLGKRQYLDPLSGGTLGKRQFFDALAGEAFGRQRRAQTSPVVEEYLLDEYDVPIAFVALAKTQDDSWRSAPYLGGPFPGFGYYENYI